MKKGFTLIEVLCVIAILGVITAFMINAVSQSGLKEQQRNKYLLKKAYVNLSENVSNSISNRQIYPTGKFNESYATNTSSANKRQVNFCDDFISTINTLGDMDKSVCEITDKTPEYKKGEHLAAASYEPSSGRIISSDKMVWWGLGGSGSAGNCTINGQKRFCDTHYPKTIVVDINGTDIQRNPNVEEGKSDKSKNIFGLDIFRFKLYEDGRIELIDDKIAFPYKNKEDKKIETAQQLLLDAGSTKF